MTHANPGITLVQGTWGGKWAQPGHPFRELLVAQGFDISERTEFWSHDVVGMPSLWDSEKHSDWKIGGAFLGEKLRRRPHHRRLVIAHSWGGAVAQYAAAREKVYIHRLITVATPERADMLDVAQAARANIGYWLNVGDVKGDWWQRLAQLFDGKAGGWSHQQRHAHNNMLYPKVGHSGLFEPAHYDKWRKELLYFLTATDAQLGVNREQGV